MSLTPEDLIAMAREAGASIERWMTNPPKVAGVHMSPEQLEVFASLVSARTREECAVACEAGIDEAMEAKMLSKSQRLAGKDDELEALKFWSTVSLYNNARKLCAAAIRAMGERT